LAAGTSTQRRKKEATVATQRATDEADIRRRIDEAVAAVRAMDLEGLMALYARDVVSFDVAGPLRYVGADAKRKAWVEAFAVFRPPLAYEIRELAVAVGGDVAFAHGLNRLSGTSKDGSRTGFWVRWTACFRKLDGDWLVVHDQASVPFDPGSGKASLNLEP
jgi:uncharacterized protein (TIGR02246 family)